MYLPFQTVHRCAFNITSWCFSSLLMTPCCPGKGARPPSCHQMLQELTNHQGFPLLRAAPSGAPRLVLWGCFVGNLPNHTYLPHGCFLADVTSICISPGICFLCTNHVHRGINSSASSMRGHTNCHGQTDKLWLYGPPPKRLENRDIEA